MKTNSFFGIIIVVIAVFTTLNSYAKKFTYNENKLGGDFKLVFYTTNKSDADKTANQTYLYVDKLNAILSNYLLSSEVSLLNKKGKYPNPSIELIEVLNYSQLAFNKTDGYFDVSIQPLIELWNKAEEKGKIPSDKYLRRKGAEVGFNDVLRNDNDCLILKSKSELELGGIAKGFIIDKVYEYLKNMNFNSFLIEAAGDIRVFGSPEDEEFWTVGVSSNNEHNYVVQLKSGQAIATSGNTYRFRIIEGKKYSHIINPKSFMPVTHSLSASVIADSATTADYLASTFNIVTDKTEISTILNRHNNVEILIFNNHGIFFETEKYFNNK